MDERPTDRWEATVRRMASSFPYPPTPDVSRAVRRRLATRSARSPALRPRLAWAALLLLLVLGGLLAVPQVRAAVAEVLRVGAIRIFATEPTATAVPPTATDAGATTVPQLTLNETVFEVAGATTLAQAREAVDFPVRLPAYPTDLGPPDRVYLQQVPDTGAEGQVVISIWFDGEQQQEIQLALYQIGVPSYGLKVASVNSIEETRVNGESAFWIAGAHAIQLQDGRYQERLFVEGNVLVWSAGNLTYRLESDLSLAETVRVAESLQTMSPFEEE